jgi:hypothetical protein
LHTTAKVAALIAALGFVTMMLEQPRLTAAPSRSSATIAQSLEAGDDVAAPASLSASNSLPAYFPGQFAPPKGEAEPLPATF